MLHTQTFTEPVGSRVMMTFNGATLGPYFEVVRKPMSLRGVEQAIVSGEVTTLEQLQQRIVFIGANCVMFNAPEGNYPCMARAFVERCLTIIEEVR